MSACPPAPPPRPRPARVFVWLGLIVPALVVVALLAACGGSGSSSGSSSRSGTTVASRLGATGATRLASQPPKPPPPPPTHTSCRAVVYIGDSTSDGEVESDYVPNPRQRLPAQLAKVGVRTTYPEVSGARSIVETFEGIPNGATVAKAHVSSGYRGCWILALGTNEAADVAAGSEVGLTARIARMMSIIGNQPVVWVNVITLPGAPRYYGEDGMRRWNQDLLAACPKHPLMRVFDWAARARRNWFIPDGVHYTTAGYVVRTRLIAHALVHAFPNGEPASASCVVR